MRIASIAFLVSSLIAGCLLFTAGSTNAEVSVSNVIVAQAGSDVKSFKKQKKREGGESCSVVCNSGATANQSCTAKYPTCRCSCSSSGASCYCGP